MSLWVYGYGKHRGVMTQARARESLEGGRLVSRTNAVMCNGYGACAAGCCNGAITMKHYRDDRICALIDALCEVV